MSEKAHLAAVKALLTTADANPYTMRELKTASPAPTSYNEVHVTQRYGSGPRRQGAPSGTTQWRILIRSVAKIYDNAQEMRDAAAALHEAKLTVDGETYFIERSVSDDLISEDDGWWSGVSEYTY